MSLENQSAHQTSTHSGANASSAAPSSDLVLIHRSSDGRIVELTIHRPQALNALNRAVLQALDETFAQLATEKPTPACVIVTGSGTKAFVAGADIAEMATMHPAEADAMSRLGHAVCTRIENFPAPVIAAVNGFALGGGCELALACDVIYAASNAKFGQPEVKLGLMPGFGGAARLPRKIGIGAASEWIFTGDIYSVEEAHRVGLVHKVFAPEVLLDEVRKIAATIARRAPLAVQASKKVIQQGMGMDHVSALVFERQHFAALFATHDVREGTSAFVQKREPQFTGT